MPLRLPPVSTRAPPAAASCTQLFDALGIRLANHRAHLRLRIELIAGAQRRDLRLQHIQKLVVNLIHDQITRWVEMQTWPALP